jgi:beta-carotene 3-hydroxylase
MSAPWLIPALIVAATVVVMEGVAAGVHRFVMHGVGWTWHRSHHEPRTRLFEMNDLYAVVFAVISIVCFAAGAKVPALWWIGLGMVVYGVLYTLLHAGCRSRRRHAAAI